MARIAALLLLAGALRAGSVEIAFTDSVTRAPIPGLVVTINGPAALTATTDGAGVARFENAPPGNYSIGYKTVGNYMPSLTETVQPVRVADEPVRVFRKMIPLARVQGRILFPDGKPAIDALVSLGRYRRGGGLQQRTDAQGRFTFAGISPGRYALAANASYRSKALEGEAWAPGAYPGSIILTAGADLSGYDIRLRSVPVYRVRGIVRDDVGRPAAGAAINVVDVDSPVPGQRKIVSGEDGTFDLAGVRAGEWRLVATLDNLKAVEPLAVAGRDVERFEIRLARPFTVEATVERDVLKPATAVSLVPGPDRREMQVLAFHDEDGAAALKNVYPGRYRVELFGFVPGYFVDTVKFGERDVLGHFIDVFEGAPPIRVIYSDGAPFVRARVEKGAGAFVLLVPQQEILRTEQFIGVTAANSDGRCEVSNLRPGDYYAFAVDRWDRAALQDAAFVESLLPRAAKVHVEKGATPTVELKVTVWPE